MAKKTKTPLLYSSEGSDKPVTGQLMMWNGTEWIPVNSASAPISTLFVNQITLGGCTLKVVSGALCVYQVSGNSEILRARIILSNGDIEGFSL